MIFLRICVTQFLCLLLCTGWTGMFVARVLCTTYTSSRLSEPSSSSSPGLFWQHKAAMDDTVSSPEPGSLPHYLTVPSIGHCALECRQQAWCASFFFSGDQNQGNCLLENVVLQSKEDAGPAKGFRYFFADSGWCDANKGFIFYPGERLCIRVFTELVTHWGSAVARCQAEGLQLAVPESALQTSLLQATVNRSQAFRKRNNYLGITRPRDEWNLPWEGGLPSYVDIHNKSVSMEVLAKRLWAPNNPNNQKDKQNCVQIDKKRNSLLNDLSCNYKNYFTCQKVWK